MSNKYISAENEKKINELLNDSNVDAALKNL